MSHEELSAPRFNASRRWAANWGPQRRTALRTRRLIAASRRTSSRRRQRCGRWDFRREDDPEHRRQMCHPAAPMEMKRRSILCDRVSRVPLPSGSSSHRRSLPPQLYSSTSGSVGSRHFCFGNERRWRSYRGELHRASSRTQVRHRRQRAPTRGDAPGRSAPARLFPASGAVL